jgi:hypothetical protein
VERRAELLEAHSRIRRKRALRRVTKRKTGSNLTEKVGIGTKECEHEVV